MGCADHKGALPCYAKADGPDGTPKPEKMRQGANKPIPQASHRQTGQPTTKPAQTQRSKALPATSCCSRAYAVGQKFLVAC